MKDTWMHPKSAAVTVWKLVQGQKCCFTATARWWEYFPKLDSQQFMWRKMPYTAATPARVLAVPGTASDAERGGHYSREEIEAAIISRIWMNPCVIDDLIDIVPDATKRYYIMKDLRESGHRHCEGCSSQRPLSPVGDKQATLGRP